MSSVCVILKSTTTQKYLKTSAYQGVVPQLVLFWGFFPPSDQLFNKLGKRRKTGLICSPFGPNSCLYTPDASSSSRLRLILSPHRSPFRVAVWSNNSSNLLGRKGGEQKKKAQIEKNKWPCYQNNIRVLVQFYFIFFSECLLMMIPFWCLFWFCWVCFARCRHTYTHTHTHNAQDVHKKANACTQTRRGSSLTDLDSQMYASFLTRLFSTFGLK